MNTEKNEKKVNDKKMLLMIVEYDENKNAKK